VSFHNPESEEIIADDERLKMEIAVSVLELQLALSPTPLVPQEKVFIVHGHDHSFRKELQSILKNQAKVDYVVIQALARTGQDLLSFLEEKIRNCVAGFVLLTPDDEGRLFKFGESMRQRARQNVIFEGGYLTALFRRKNRICFLQKGDIEVPSDLNGLLMERFPERIDADRILLTLAEWGLGDTSAVSYGQAADEGATGPQSVGIKQ
jgi:predicted nucleotide-binding protein